MKHTGTFSHDGDESQVGGGYKPPPPSAVEIQFLGAVTYPSILASTCEVTIACATQIDKDTGLRGASPMWNGITWPILAKMTSR